MPRLFILLILCTSFCDTFASAENASDMPTYATEETITPQQKTSPPEGEDVHTITENILFSAPEDIVSTQSTAAQQDPIVKPAMADPSIQNDSAHSAVEHIAENIGDNLDAKEPPVAPPTTAQQPDIPETRDSITPKITERLNPPDDTEATIPTALMPATAPTSIDAQKFAPTIPLTDSSESEDVIMPQFETIRLNEILPNPAGNDAGREYVELYNYGDEDVHLTTWSLCAKTKCDNTFGEDIVLAPHTYKVFYNTVPLINSTKEISLKTPNGTTISSFEYPTATENMSWNYDKEWYEGLPTPNEVNIPNPLTQTYPSLYINELLPDPIGKDSAHALGEFIEIYNPHNISVDLTGWSFIATSQSGISRTHILQDAIISPQSFLVFYKNNDDFSFNLTNTHLTITLVAPNTAEKSSVSYIDAPEGSSYNFDGHTWHWSTLLTAGTPNDFPPDPTMTIYPQLILNELFPYPSDVAQQDEFIELFNPGSTPVHVEGWSLRDASQNGLYIFEDVTIPAQEFFVVDKKTFGFALNNSGGETVSLMAPNDVVVDTMTYTIAHKDASFSRAKEQWHWTPVLTPGRANEFLSDNVYPQLLITELFPNPQGDETTQEYIEIYNPTDTPISLDYWRIMDSSQTGIYTFPQGLLLGAHSFYVLSRADFGFALNNSGGETVSLMAPNDVVTSTVSYVSAKENVSYGWTGEKWRWSAMRTPAQDNIFGEELLITDIIIDKHVYQNAYADFSVKGSVDGDDIKYRWDFGDDHRSYLRKTRHKYEKTGKYSVHVRISNDIEEITKEFTIDVKKYPRYKLRITEISPNPTGTDYANEYIIIANDDDKKIDFKGWSIATGKDEDHLVNHPFRKDLTLKSGKLKKVRSPYAAISLPNKGGVVELRAPDGSVVHSKKYDYNDRASIPADSIYKKVDGTWQWIIPPKSLLTTNISSSSRVDRHAIITQALRNDLQKRVAAIQIARDRHPTPKTTTETTHFLKKSLMAFNSILHFVFTALLTEKTANIHTSHNLIIISSQQSHLCDTYLSPHMKNHMATFCHVIK